jgi:hypothetical protein
MDALPVSGPIGTICPNFRASSAAEEDEELEVDNEEKDSSEVEADEEERSARSNEPVMVALPTGEALQVAEIGTITRATPTRVIVIAGEADCGKSTLLACLNESFQRGPYAGFLFAGSSTLVAFEKICHHARVSSERSRPDTERTLLEEGTRFLHLSVRREDLSEAARHILISNTSGEIFKRLRDLSEEATPIQFLKRADHFVLFLNGEKLAHKSYRAEVKVNVGQTLRRLIEEGLLGSQSQVDVLTSKWDAIVSSPHQDSEGFVAGVEATIRKRFEPQLGRLRFFHVAPRPEPASQLKPGHGLEDLFASWVNESGVVCLRVEGEEEQTSQNGNGRESSRFVWTLK